jgi:glycosyltransferase involved in cell wall biosynthesis
VAAWTGAQNLCRSGRISNKQELISIKPLKILLVVTLSEIGGAQKMVYHIAAGLEPALFDVTVACAPGGELVHWLRALVESRAGLGETGPSVQAGSGETGPAARLRNPRVVEIPELKRDISPLQDLRALWRLYGLIRRERFDVVHCHSSKAGLLGRLAGWLAGAPKIYFTAHGWGINEYQSRPFRLFFTLTERLAGALSTGVICVSRYDYEKALALKLVRPGKLAVIYNGLPEPGEHAVPPGTLQSLITVSELKFDEPGGVQRVAPAGIQNRITVSEPQSDNPGVFVGKKCVEVHLTQNEKLKKELGLAGTDRLAVTVMRLAPPKELLLFLEVARRLVQLFPDLYFTVIGDGPLRVACETFIQENGMTGRAFMTGTREDAAELVAGCEVLLHFSRWEGLPLTIIEAMLAGVPVVANRVGGIGELVADGETGLLIDRLDVQAAVRACEVLLGSQALRRQYGEAGRARARRLFSLAEMQLQYRKLYLEEGSAGTLPVSDGNH